MTLDWAEARAIAFEVGAARRTGTERIPLADAAGRIVAEPVSSRADVPAADSSAMDGWVVSGPGPWLVEAEIVIGDAPLPSPLPFGVARPIATGAPVPPGDAAILRRERGELRDGVLHVAPDAVLPVPGADIRRHGEEVTSGERILDAGRVLTPPALALAAACGHDRLLVCVPPVVDLLVLGLAVV